MSMKPLTGVLLAAGHCRRFGSSKLISRLPKGEYVGVAAARQLMGVVPRRIAVVRPMDTGLAEQFRALGYQVVENTQENAGMGDSLAMGVCASADAGGWLVALGDMPWIHTSTLHQLVERLQGGASIVAPAYAGQRGHPVGFAEQWGGPLSNLSGDEGAKSLLTTHSNELEIIPIDDPGVVLDVDKPSDLANISARMASSDSQYSPDSPFY
jgi:molybdenum cofactor cytidylyltransferase